MKRFSVFLPDELRLALDRAAQDQGVSVGYLLRKILTDWINKSPV